MSTKLKIILAVVLVIIVAGGFITYNQVQSKKSVKPVIKTATVKKGTVSIAVTATGTLQPLTTVSVKSNVGGQVMKLNVIEGMKVKMGDIIAQIDPADSQSAYNQAMANYQSANAKISQAQLQAKAQPKLSQANISQAESNLSVAQAESQRQHELYGDNGSLGFTPEKSVELADEQVKQAQNALNQAKANQYQDQSAQESVITAKAAMTSAQAALDNAKTNLDYCTVIAPRDGVVIKKYVEEGGMVAAGKSSGSATGPGISIVDIADISHMYATVNVDETDIGKIKVGQQVDVSVDAYSSDVFFGSVTKIAPQTVVTQNVTTIPVTVQVDSVDNRLLTGMNATCNFIIDQKKNVIAIPNEAVKSDSSGSYVQVLVGDVPTRRPVEIGMVGDAKTEVISGVAVDEKVITSIVDPSKIKPGAAAGATGTPAGLSGGGGRPPGR